VKNYEIDGKIDETAFSHGNESLSLNNQPDQGNSNVGVVIGVVYDSKSIRKKITKINSKTDEIMVRRYGSQN